MPVNKVPFRNFVRGLWLKGPKENTPPDSLRRAKSIFPLRGGSIRSRSGSLSMFNVNSNGLFKFASNRIIGSTTGQLFKGTTPGTETLVSGLVTQGGGQWRFMEIPAQFLATNPKSTETDFLFVTSRSFQPFNIFAQPYKLDSSFNQSNWGIEAPSSLINTGFAPFAAATNTPTTTQIEDFEDKTTFRYAQSTGGFSTDPTNDSNRFLQGTKSLQVDLATDSHITVTKAFTGSFGTVDEDYVQIAINTGKPKHIKSIEIKIFVGPDAFNAGDFGGAFPSPFPVESTKANPFKHFFHRELKIKPVRRQLRKKLIGLGDVVRQRDVPQFLKDFAKGNKRDFSQAEFVFPDTVAVVRNAWTIITLPKGTFDRSGNAGQVIGVNDFTFANVKGFQIGVETNKNGPASVWFDDLKTVSGPGLRGDYLYTLTYLNDNTGSRSNPPLDADGNVTTASVKDVDRQSIALTGIPATAPTRLPVNASGNDPQVTHVEIWRNVGNGGLQFFFVDKVPIGTTTFTDTVADYIGFDSSSAKVLDPTKQLTFDNAPFAFPFNSAPGNTIQNATSRISQAVYHHVSGRVFGFDHLFPSRLVYSPVGRPESLTSFIEPSTPDDPIQFLVVWNEALFVFTQKGLFELITTDEPFIAHQVVGAVGTNEPETVVATPAGIFYSAFDGVRLYDGAISRIVDNDSLANVMRANFITGQAVEGIPPFHGRVATYGRDEYFISDTTLTTLAFNVLEGTGWRNVGLAAQALYAEKDTSVVLAALPAGLAGGVLIVGRFAATTFDNTATTNFISLNGRGGTTTLFDKAKSRVPLPVTFIAMSVTLTVAISGGGTAKFQLMVDGVDQPGLTVTIASGSSTGSATGSVLVQNDSFVALHVTFTGGTTLAGLKACALGYTTAG